MSAKKKPSHKPDKDAYAIVGELVLKSTALDHLLNRVLITVLNLGDSVLLEPVIATLDPNRKVEILKARAKLISSVVWKRRITEFCNRVDSVFKQRNIACHTLFIQWEGGSAFSPVAAAKMLKNLDLNTKTLSAFPLSDIKTAITTSEAAQVAGINLIEDSERVNAAVRNEHAAAAKGG